MGTSGVSGSVPVGELRVEMAWRSTCARTSVVAGVVALVAVGWWIVTSLTFWLDALPDLGSLVGLLAMAAIGVGIVTGFLGRRSRRRRSALVGSLLSVVAIVGFGFAAFLPYEPYVTGMSWAPDGTRIAYRHLTGNYEEDGIWVVSADGSSQPSRLTAAGDAPAWSPDGKTVAFVVGGYGGDLWLMDADGANQRKLTPARQQDRVTAAFGPGPSWSPDGTQVVFAGAPQGEGSDGIWTVDVDGANLHRIAVGGDAPAWSPDGSWIVYLIQQDNPNGQQAGYWVVGVDGSGAMSLPGDNSGAPHWASDGRITVDCPEGTCAMAADGSDRAVLVPGHTGAILSPGLTTVAYVTGVGFKSDIVVATLDASTATTLIH